MFGAKRLALMGILVALNVGIGGLVHLLKLPIFLDAIGTILAVLLIGWRAGLLVGAISFIVAAAVLNPVYIWFIGTQLAIASVVYIGARQFRAFSSITRTVVLGLAVGAVAGIVSAPVIVLVFGGVTGSGRDLITVALMSTGEQIVRAVAFSGIASEPVDKTLQCVIALLTLRLLPKRLLQTFRNPTLERSGLL